MPFESLVRTKQINKPEFSGYIVDVLLQYLKTGSITGIAMNTGQLSGQFYPLQSNPSGYITSGYLSGYATQQYVNNADTAVLSYIGGTYYPVNNPSGFVTSGQLTGIAEVTGDIIIMGTGGISVTGVNGIIIISGDGTANNLTGYVPWTYFSSGWSLTLPYISLADSYLPGKLIFANASHEYLLEGYRTGYPTEKYFIDFYGLSASRYGLTYTRPTIFGFDVSGGFMSSSGYPVLTTKDLTGLASWNQLLITSGQLEDDIWRVRTDVMDALTGSSGYMTLVAAGRVYSGQTFLSGVGGLQVLTGGAHTILFSGGGASFSTGGFVDLGSFQTILGNKSFSGSTRFAAIRPPVGKSIIDMSTKRMQFEDIDVLDWTGQWLISATDYNKTLDWTKRLAFDSSNVISIDWEHRKLSGNWNVGTGVVYVTGNQAITGVKTFQTILVGKPSKQTSSELEVNGNAYIRRDANNLISPAWYSSGWDSSVLFNGINIVSGYNSSSIATIYQYFQIKSGSRYQAAFTGSINGVGAVIFMSALDSTGSGAQVSRQLSATVTGVTVVDWVSNRAGTEFVTFIATGVTNSNIGVSGFNVYELSGGNLTVTGDVILSNGYIRASSLTGGGWTAQSLTISGYPVMVSSGQTFGSSSAGGVTGIRVTGLTITGLVDISGEGGIVPRITGNTLIISGGSTINTGDFEPRLLGEPTDGSYGGPNGAIAGIQVGDTHPDAFDKIEVVLGKLAPSKPANLSQSAFILTGSLYSAFMQGTTTQYTGVQATQRPTGYATGFYDGDYGVLSGFINGLITGSEVLSTGVDTGNYTGLVIYADFDFWSGVAGKAGFWSALNARVSPTGWLQSGRFTMQMKHSTAGDSPIITGYCDVPTPAASMTLTNTSWVTGACTLRYIDGVPGLASNDPVKASFTGGGAITAFYSSPVARLTSAQLSTSNILPTLNPTSGQSMALSGTGLGGASTYSTGIVITGTLYNSISGSNTTTIATNVRIDTVSTQQTGRKTAGSGQWPAGGYGTGYDNNSVFSGNEELQMVAGSIQYPPKVNYGSFIPPGPNYANIPSGSNSGYRWAFFDCGSLSNISNIQVTFNGTSNFGASTILTGFQLFAKVSGAIGWIDGNAAYPGVGNPSTNGAPALVVGSSSATVKLITFGTATLSGPVYIRVGLPSGSTRSFTTVSFQTA